MIVLGTIGSGPRRGSASTSTRNPDRVTCWNTSLTVRTYSRIASPSRSMVTGSSLKYGMRTTGWIGVDGLAGVPGDRLVVEGVLDVPLSEVVASWEGRLPEALGHGTAQG